MLPVSAAFNSSLFLERSRHSERGIRGRVVDECVTLASRIHPTSRQLFPRTRLCCCTEAVLTVATPGY